MTQFAYFTGVKPRFKEYEFVPLITHHTKGYIGSVLTPSEIQKSWVINAIESEPIDDMACEAMESAQISSTIEDTELYELILSYLEGCESITFIYGVYKTEIPIYSSPIDFIKAITKSLHKAPFQIYAKYVAC